MHSHSTEPEDFSRDVEGHKELLSSSGEWVGGEGARGQARQLIHF